MSIRDAYDGRKMPPNGNGYISAYCVRGVRKVFASRKVIVEHLLNGITRVGNTIGMALICFSLQTRRRTGVVRYPLHEAAALAEASDKEHREVSCVACRYPATNFLCRQ